MQSETKEPGAGLGRYRRTIHLVLFGLVVAYAALLATTYAMGVWLVGKDGQPVAADFVAFWAAGKLVLRGAPAAAYDWTAHKDVATAGGIAIKGYFSFQYPPTFLLLTPLLALASYPVAMVLWSAVGLPLYLCAVRLAVGGWNATLAALAWPAVLWNTVVGQTGFLTAALLGAGIALIDRRPALAGVLFGLLTYKPQFGLLIPVALMAGGRWRVVAWAALSTAALAATATLAFGIPVWSAFFDSIARINDAILTSGRTDFGKLQSLYGFLRAQDVPARAAWMAHGTLVVALAIGVARLWRSDAAFDLKAAALAIATILASPYAFIYDLVVLAIPLAFLGRTGFSPREAAVVVAAALLVGWGPADHIATGLAAGLLILALVIARAARSETLRSRTWQPAPER
ncbi:glycosyltransferase family 87 protein [Mesorhizobium sp. ZMM04-5]|uniref:Glycosyltransferase family 87 protein n=1 Tax=Mesorhizobium marinum TaxID=3228790 RepID=A0ABV3R6P4_9HYPH